MQMTFAQVAAKPAPERYRRASGNQARPTMPGAAVPVGSRGSAVHSRPNSHYGSVDDLHVSRQHAASDEAQRLRRRSMHNLDASSEPAQQDFTRPSRTPTPKTAAEQQQKTLRLVTGDPTIHMRSGSSDSAASSLSSHSRPSSRPSSVSGALLPDPCRLPNHGIYWFRLAFPSSLLTRMFPTVDQPQCVRPHRRPLFDCLL
jgi:hypothetical protein